MNRKTNGRKLAFATILFIVGALLCPGSDDSWNYQVDENYKFSQCVAACEKAGGGYTECRLECAK